MALADRLINKADKLLTKYLPTDRDVYKRTIVRTGGDALLGRPGSVVRTDTLLVPQPMVTVLDLTRTNTARDYLAITDVGLEQVGDYIVEFSASSISTDELANPDLVIVFKRGTAAEEMVIVTFNPLVVNGRAVLYNALVRSKKRQ